MVKIVETQPEMESGSLRAIVYVFFQLIDEIMHTFDFLLENAEWRYSFCQWAHRHDC